MWSLQGERHVEYTHFQVEVENDQFEVEFSTSRTMWQQMMAT